MMKKIKAFVIAHKKLVTISACSLLAAALTVGGVIAYLTSKTTPAVNTMTKGTCGSEVKEGSFDGETKSNVYIHNTGTVASYIRVKLVPTWEAKDKDGNLNPTAISVLNTDLTITFADDFAANWIAGDDGYYYFKSMVPADDNNAATLTDCTTQLIKTAVVNPQSKTAKKGYRMNLNVLAESIQGDPPEAVNNAWGRTVVDGKLS